MARKRRKGRLERLVNFAENTYKGRTKRRVKRAVKRAVIRRGLRWGILG